MRPRLLALTLLLSAPLQAQSFGRVEGLVFDSLLTRGPLAGAEVEVLGLARTTVTDAGGRWHLDSVPAGRWRVAFSHPVLEEARLSPAPQSVDVLADETASMALTTPSEATLYTRACPEPRAIGTGLLLGNATADQLPAGGASTRVLWREWTLKAGAEPEETSKEANFTLDPSGRFSICGVPSDRLITVAASRDGRSATREVRLEGRQLGLVHLALGEGASAMRTLAVTAVEPDAASVVVVDADAGGPITLRGSVRDRDGRPLPEARVEIIGTEVRTVTGADGSFQFANVPREVQTLEVAGLGHVPRRVEVDLRPGRMQRADIALEKVAFVLKPLLADGKADPRMAALERRLRIGNGQYLTASQVEQRHAASVSDLLKGMLGVQVTMSGMNTVVVMTRNSGVAGRYFAGGCVPAFFVDGSMVGTESMGSAEVDSTLYSTAGAVPVQGVATGSGNAGPSPLLPRDIGPDQFVSVNDIETVEVYNSATMVPPEFATYNGACGIVAIWTKRTRPVVRTESDGT